MAQTVSQYGTSDPTGLNAGTIKIGFFDSILATSYFTGRDYGIIAVMANLDASTIASTEVWLGAKTGFFAPVISGTPTIGVT